MSSADKQRHDEQKEAEEWLLRAITEHVSVIKSKDALPVATIIVTIVAESASKSGSLVSCNIEGNSVENSVLYAALLQGAKNYVEDQVHGSDNAQVSPNPSDPKRHLH